MPTTYAIPNGRTVMDATTYTANGGVQTVNNADTGSNGFYPDFIWTKPRSITSNHQLVDSVRGSQYFLYSNLTNGEGNNNQFVTGFNNNGFGLGTANYGSGTTMVAWQWNAGSGTTSTNTNGILTSTVSVNATAGFSVVTWTAPGSSQANSVGHGLGVAPAFVITKCHSGGSGGLGWAVYHQSLGANQVVELQSTSAVATSAGYWGSGMTSTVVGLPTCSCSKGYDNNTGNMVAYCWAEIAGFSQFGSYTGNGSADGPFIYTGFKPKFLMYKRTDSAGSWFMVDSTRNPSNTANYWLQANTSDVEQTDDAIDLNSNGFKIRTTGTGTNASGGSYVYMVWAENPFKYANAR